MNHRHRARRAVEEGLPTEAVLRITDREIDALVQHVAAALRVCEREARRAGIRSAVNAIAGEIDEAKRAAAIDRALALERLPVAARQRKAVV